MRNDNGRPLLAPNRSLEADFERRKEIVPSL
jgi:hypothetical protein